MKCLLQSIADEPNQYDSPADTSAATSSSRIRARPPAPNALWAPAMSGDTGRSSSTPAAPPVESPRLRLLVSELCPLLDRFGRVLTDLAPHLRTLADLPEPRQASALGREMREPEASSSASASASASSSVPASSSTTSSQISSEESPVMRRLGVRDGVGDEPRRMRFGSTRLSHADSLSRVLRGDTGSTEMSAEAALLSLLTSRSNVLYNK